MSEKKTIITAGLWVIIAYGLSQVLRLGSNLVVTRLLAPELFGFMAIVHVVMYGITMLSDLGLWTFVVRHKEGDSPKILNTVWTIQVIRGWFIFLWIVVIAVSLSEFKHLPFFSSSEIYSNDTLPLLLVAMGVTAIFSGFQTMAPAVLSRELKRGKLELIELLSQIVGLSVMIFWAWKAPSVWALVSAGIVSSIICLILNYALFPIRHKFSWDKQVAKEVYNFGKWIVLASGLTFIAAQGDRLFFGAHLSAAKLGVYSVAFMLSLSAIALVQQLTFKIWFPLLSKVSDNREALKKLYYQLRLKQDFIVFIFAGLFFSFAPKIIEILYDDRYAEAGWVLQIFSISLVGEGLSIVGLESLSALGITKYRMKFMFVRCLGIIVGLPYAFDLYGFSGAVYCVAINVFLGLPIIYMELYKNKIFSFFKEIRMLPLFFVGYYVGMAILLNYERVISSIILLLSQINYYVTDFVFTIMNILSTFQ